MMMEDGLEITHHITLDGSHGAFSQSQPHSVFFIMRLSWFCFFFLHSYQERAQLAMGLIVERI
jgi:hypothetical protein